LQNGRLTHPNDVDAPLHVAAQCKIKSYRQQYADNQNILFSPRHHKHIHPMHGEFLRLLFYRPTGRTRRTSLPLECHRRTRGGQSGGITDQPQCRGLWHSSSPSALSLSRSPSSPTPSFTQSPSPPRSLVRDGQTSPHRPRLVISHSTCPPLSPSPHANSFTIA
jgi:hypothetical protein